MAKAASAAIKATLLIDTILHEGLARFVHSAFFVSNVRLPSTRSEIDAAVHEIMKELQRDCWSTDRHGRDVGNSRLGNSEEEAVEKQALTNWLAGVKFMGAVETGRLNAMVNLNLLREAPGLGRLGSRRIVAVLARGRWRYMQAASTF
jgi:hypothetical protein